MNEKKYLTSPTGRLVQGDCFDPQTTDKEGSPLVFKSGQFAGQPRKNFFYAIAIQKTDPGLAAFQAAITAEARKMVPGSFDPSGNLLHPQFNFKWIDGDSQTPDENGKRPCDKEGFKGCIVFRFSSSFFSKCFTTDNPPQEIITPASVKRGYFIRVICSVVTNASASKPGIILNHHGVQLKDVGPEILSGPDCGAMFSEAGDDAPPPADDFLNPPAGTDVTPPPPPVEEKFMAPGGKVCTRAKLEAGGWSPAQIAALPKA